MTKRNPNDGRQPFIRCGGLQLLNAIKLADGQMGLVTVALGAHQKPVTSPNDPRVSQQ